MALLTERSVPPAMADARAAACLAVLMDAADQISDTNHSRVKLAGSLSRDRERSRPLKRRREVRRV